MKSSILCRIAAVLLLLFAVAHTLGFPQSDPAWGGDGLLHSMRSTHFAVQGFRRTYGDLFVAAGLSVGVFYFFAGILAWQFGGLGGGDATLAEIRGARWVFALAFAAVTGGELVLSVLAADRFLDRVRICVEATSQVQIGRREAIEPFQNMVNGAVRSDAGDRMSQFQTDPIVSGVAASLSSMTRDLWKNSSRNLSCQFARGSSQAFEFQWCVNCRVG